MKSKIMFGLGYDNNPVLKFKISHDTEDVRDDIAAKFINKEGDLCLIFGEKSVGSDEYYVGQIERTGEGYILNHFSEQIRQCAEFIANKKISIIRRKFNSGEIVKELDSDTTFITPVTHEDVKEWKEAYFSQAQEIKLKREDKI